MDQALTKNELVEVLSDYITPLYQVIGAACAALVILLAVIVVILPFMKRIK